MVFYLTAIFYKENWFREYHANTYLQYFSLNFFSTCPWPPMAYRRKISPHWIKQDRLLNFAATALSTSLESYIENFLVCLALCAAVLYNMAASALADNSIHILRIDYYLQIHPYFLNIGKEKLIETMIAKFRLTSKRLLVNQSLVLNCIPKIN